ncbi:hypothetical protein Tco_1219998 [Tanacetum coccineum]
MNKEKSRLNSNDGGITGYGVKIADENTGGIILSLEFFEDDMIEKTMEVFMDDFLVFGNSFRNCLSRVDKMLKWCEDTNLCLNWEKHHFMVKEGIDLGHKISKNGIEVNKAKVDVIAKLPHPTTVKGVRSFLSHASFYRREITVVILVRDRCPRGKGLRFLNFFNDPRIIREQRIAAYKGYRGGGNVGGLDNELYKLVCKVEEDEGHIGVFGVRG